MKKTGFAAMVFWMSLLCTHAFAQPTKVLFFEAALAPADTTFSNEPTGFSKLVNSLKEGGMLVASMSSGEITREKLSSYEIVVLHPSPERPFEESEISALVWFVAQDGGALFVHGGDAKIVNPLIEIFGVSTDSSNLVDASSAMEGSADGRKFVLTRFPPAASFDMAAENIESIGFYGGAPLALSSDAAPIATGDEDCYSDNGLYSIGSLPPVAAAAFFGRGMVLAKNDRAIFNNENIEMYHNMKWAGLVFRNLAGMRDTGLERDESLLGLRSRLAKLLKKRKAWSEERKKNEADLEASYRKAKALRSDLEKSQTKRDDLMEEQDRLTAENDRLERRLARYESRDTLKMAGAVAAVVLLVALLLGLLIGRRSARDRV